MVLHPFQPLPGRAGGAAHPVGRPAAGSPAGQAGRPPGGEAGLRVLQDPAARRQRAGGRRPGRKARHASCAAPKTPAQQAPAPVQEAAAKPVERLYLQVGAFENPGEADNLKARLALAGIEASAQRAQLADGRVVHRVRIGPFSSPEDMNPTRARLAAAGFNASVSRSNP
ncbi:SPOR domain-containing protein [Thauera humireducens]|uniref:SPOR domain-containing protein n=1 Tax=Thauera humireducens TaxID=1134435 RepID=UPI00311E1A8C